MKNIIVGFSLLYDFSKKKQITQEDIGHFSCMEEFYSDFFFLTRKYLILDLRTDVQKMWTLYWAIVKHLKCKEHFRFLKVDVIW